MNAETLFAKLFNAKTEEEVLEIINANPKTFKNENWVPIGNNDINYVWIIENQQSNPIAALVEKIIKCLYLLKVMIFIRIISYVKRN